MKPIVGLKNISIRWMSTQDNVVRIQAELQEAKEEVIAARTELVCTLRPFLRDRNNVDSYVAHTLA